MSRVVVGLPSGPRPTRPHSRPRNEPDRHDRAPPPRQIHSQKSVTFQPKERSVLATPRRAQTPSITSSRSSNDSESSISSRSIFDHIRSGTGYASSITSFEDDDKMRDGPQKAQSLRRRADTEGQGNYSEPEGTSSNGIGSTLWNRVAVAASGLTVNVSKAWASNVATMSGEETPPGQESRLTRAMKTYHLEKARDRSDLPAWLFEEHERMPRHHLSESTTVTPVERPAARGKGLQEIYESAASTAIITSRRSDQSTRYMDGDTHPSKATDRLKAIRDAKRAVLQPQSTDVHQSVKSDTVGVRGNEDADGRGMGGGRVGLPSGPGPRSRRYK